MRAAYLHGVGDVRVEEVPEPVLLEATDAIVRVTRAGLCGSELPFYRAIPDSYRAIPGEFRPTALGHEFVGIVEEIGSGTTKIATGDFVIAAGTISDDTCLFCTVGNQNSCENGAGWGDADRKVGGGQAEFVRVPFADGTLIPVHGVGDAAPDELQASLLTVADVYSTGQHAVRTVGVTQGETVVVVGDGAVGLMSVLAARQAGAGVVVLMGHHKARGEIGLAFGANHFVEDRGEDGVARVKELIGRHGAPRVIEAVGYVSALEQAFGVVRPGGVISRISSPMYAEAPRQLDMYVHNITVTGGSASVRAYMSQLVPGILDGTVAPGKVFDRCLDLDQVALGYELMSTREASKVMLRC